MPVFLVSLATANLLKILVISLSSFGLTAAVFYGFSRKLGFREIKLHELFVYYFFYSNIWLILIIVGSIQVYGFRKKVAPNWTTEAPKNSLQQVSSSSLPVP